MHETDRQRCSQGHFMLMFQEVQSKVGYTDKEFS